MRSQRRVVPLRRPPPRRGPWRGRRRWPYLPHLLLGLVLCLLLGGIAVELDRRQAAVPTITRGTHSPSTPSALQTATPQPAPAPLAQEIARPPAAPLSTAPSPATPQILRPDTPAADCVALRIDYVYDGDTVVLQLDGAKERVRLLGFDTPEIGERARCPAEQAAAKRARDRLRALVRAAGELRFCFEGRDRYERPLAVLLLDGRDVGPLLIGEGLARPYAGGARAGWCD